VRKALLKSLKLLVFFNLLVVLAGCGYSVRGYSSKYKTIYVAAFKNSINFASENSDYSRYKSYFPLLESTITQRIIDRFMLDTNIRVVKEPEAQVILRGELIDYQRSPVRYASNNEDVEEYRVTIWVNLELFDPIDNKVVWSGNNESYYEVIGASAKSEKEALIEAVDDLARRVVDAVTESQEW